MSVTMHRAIGTAEHQALVFHSPKHLTKDHESICARPHGAWQKGVHRAELPASFLTPKESRSQEMPQQHNLRTLGCLSAKVKTSSEIVSQEDDVQVKYPIAFPPYPVQCSRYLNLACFPCHSFYLCLLCSSHKAHGKNLSEFPLLISAGLIKSNICLIFSELT